MENFRWNLESLKNEALKYNTRSDFKKGSLGAYKAANRHKVMDQISQHMLPKHTHKNPKHTLETLKIDALQFNYRQEYRKNNNSSYSAAERLGVLDIICSHMIKARNPKYIKWTPEKLQEEALKYKTRGEFREKNGSAYGISAKIKILDQICAHMPKRVDISESNNPNYKWTFEQIQCEALKFSKRSDFQKANKGMYQTASCRGLLDQVCSHMPKNYSVGRIPHNKKWTLENLKNVALNYSSYTEFGKDFPAALLSARRSGLLSEISSHMDKDRKKGELNPTFKWSCDLLDKEALKYETRTQFQIGSSGAYATSLVKGDHDIRCSHMVPPGRSESQQERDLLKNIRNQFSSAKKLRHRNISIKENPNVKGYDIDIFIPELNKGIEFDGTYYHSFDGLKRSRKKWSDDQIRNYHTDKDNYFLSRNIEILHIKEEDWIKNKEECIKNCLEFLRQPSIKGT